MKAALKKEQTKSASLEMSLQQKVCLNCDFQCSIKNALSIKRYISLNLLITLASFCWFSKLLTIDSQPIREHPFRRLIGMFRNPCKSHISKLRVSTGNSSIFLVRSPSCFVVRLKRSQIDRLQKTIIDVPSFFSQVSENAELTAICDELINKMGGQRS